MTDPSAFIPATAVRRDLHMIARELRLMSSDALSSSGLATDGARLVGSSQPDDESFRQFPATFANFQLITPPFYFDFFDWFFFPRRVHFKVGTRDQWLRLWIDAIATTDRAIFSEEPVDVTLGEFGFDWIDADGDGDGIEDPPVVAEATSSPGEYRYYFYLAKVSAGQVVATIGTTLVRGHPVPTPV